MPVISAEDTELDNGLFKYCSLPLLVSVCLYAYVIMCVFVMDNLLLTCLY